MKRVSYKVVKGLEGFDAFEQEMGELLTKGWKPVGGMTFNNGVVYQGIAKVITVNNSASKQAKSTKEAKLLGAQDAMRRVDELT